MSDKADKPDRQQDDWTRPSVSKLEADIAYFDARLCLLDDSPSSCYRNAEKKAYKTLEVSLSETLERLRNGQRKRKKKAVAAEEGPFSEFRQEAPAPPEESDSGSSPLLDLPSGLALEDPFSPDGSKG